MTRSKTSADVVFIPHQGKSELWINEKFTPYKEIEKFTPEPDLNHNTKGLSIMVSSRVDKNRDSDIQRLLDSAKKYIEPENYDYVEFIIKYDFDDEKKPSSEFFKQYPFTVKTFVYERGEGRHYNHHFSEYGFANRNTNFRWAMSMADDFYFTRSFMNELEAITDNYMIVGYTRPTFEINAECGIYRKCFPVNFDYNNGIGGYCPLMTANIIEICQNMGWQSNIDAWIVLLEATLYQKYKFLIWKELPQFYNRGGEYGLGDTPTRKNTEIYNNMTITGARLPKNPYLFKLIEQQATNLFLNIVYGDNPSGEQVEERLKELRQITPLISPDDQKPGPDWIPVDLIRYEKPPIMEWYQIG